MIYMYLAQGFEETEALSTVDVLRRAGLSVALVGVSGETVTGSHGICVRADVSRPVFDDTFEMMILPGGMPGTTNLDKSDIVEESIAYCMANDIPMAAICAAPTIYGKRGLLKGKNAVCFPKFEGDMNGARLVKSGVCTDGKFITAKSAGYSIDFGLEIVRYFLGENEAEKIRFAMYQDK